MTCYLVLRSFIIGLCKVQKLRLGGVVSLGLSFEVLRVPIATTLMVEAEISPKLSKRGEKTYENLMNATEHATFLQQRLNLKTSHSIKSWSPSITSSRILQASFRIRSMAHSESCPKHQTAAFFQC